MIYKILAKRNTHNLFKLRLITERFDNHFQLLTVASNTTVDDLFVGNKINN